MRNLNELYKNMSVILKQVDKDYQYLNHFNRKWYSSEKAAQDESIIYYQSNIEKEEILFFKILENELVIQKEQLAISHNNFIKNLKRLVMDTWGQRSVNDLIYKKIPKADMMGLFDCENYEELYSFLYNKELNSIDFTLINEWHIDIDHEVYLCLVDTLLKTFCYYFKIIGKKHMMKRTWELKKVNLKIRSDQQKYSVFKNNLKKQKNNAVFIAKNNIRQMLVHNCGNGISYIKEFFLSDIHSKKIFDDLVVSKNKRPFCKIYKCQNIEYLSRDLKNNAMIFNKKIDLESFLLGKNNDCHHLWVADFGMYKIPFIKKTKISYRIKKERYSSLVSELIDRSNNFLIERDVICAQILKSYDFAKHSKYLSREYIEKNLDLNLSGIDDFLDKFEFRSNLSRTEFESYYFYLKIFFKYCSEKRIDLLVNSSEKFELINFIYNQDESFFQEGDSPVKSYESLLMFFENNDLFFEEKSRITDFWEIKKISQELVPILSFIRNAHSHKRVFIGNYYGENDFEVIYSETSIHSNVKRHNLKNSKDMEEYFEIIELIFPDNALFLFGSELFRNFCRGYSSDIKDDHVTVIY